MSGITDNTGAKSGIVGRTTHESIKRIPEKHQNDGGYTLVGTTSGLVAWYKDGGITDSSGNSYNGTISGTVTTVNNQDGPWKGSKTCHRYPDSGGYIALPSGTAPAGTAARTTTFWYKPEGSIDSGNYLFGFGYCSTGGTWNARGTDQCMSFMGCSRDHDKDGAKIYSTQEWVRVWYIYDKAGDATLETFYTYDGTIHHNYSHELSLDTTMSGGSGTCSIGAHANDPTNNSAFGLIRDFRMYSRVLNQHEMALMWDD